jgi:DNA-binding IscR family transcriptional regulator
VAEIVRLLDGPLASVRSASKYFYRHTPMEQDPALMRLMREVRRLVVQRMEATTFGGLVRREEAGK